MRWINYSGDGGYDGRFYRKYYKVDTLHNDPLEVTVTDDLFRKWNLQRMKDKEFKADVEVPAVSRELLESRLAFNNGRMSRCIKRLQASTFRIQLEIRESSLKEFPRGCAAIFTVDFHKMLLSLQNGSSCNVIRKDFHRYIGGRFLPVNSMELTIIRFWFSGGDCLTVLESPSVHLLRRELQEFAMETRAIDIGWSSVQDVGESLVDAFTSQKVELFMRPSCHAWRSQRMLVNHRVRDQQQNRNREPYQSRPSTVPPPETDDDVVSSSDESVASTGDESVATNSDQDDNDGDNGDNGAVADHDQQQVGNQFVEEEDHDEDDRDLEVEGENDNGSGSGSNYDMSESFDDDSYTFSDEGLDDERRRLGLLQDPDVLFEESENENESREVLNRMIEE